MSPNPNTLQENKEAHFTSSDVVKDVVLGMADGLTVPFAIAMGLGGYLAAQTSVQHYATERERELYEIDHLNEREREETREIFSEYGLPQDQVRLIVDSLAKNKQKWADFMMRYELGLEKPNMHRAPISAFTIGGSYIIGGMIPLASYIALDDINSALIASIMSTTTALAIFGGIKGKLIGVSPLKSALQTVFVGGLAAGVAYWIASAIAH